MPPSECRGVGGSARGSRCSAESKRYVCRVPRPVVDLWHYSCRKITTAPRARSPARAGFQGPHAVARRGDSDNIDRRKGCWQKRSEEHKSELQSLMRNSYAVFRLKKKKHNDKSYR